MAVVKTLTFGVIGAKATDLCSFWRYQYAATMCFEGLKGKVRASSVDILTNSLRYRDLILRSHQTGSNVGGGGVGLKDDFQHLIHDQNDDALDEEVSSGRSRVSCDILMK